MTAPDARDELREYELSLDEQLAVWLAVNAPEIREPYRLGRELAERFERRARVRAAEELRVMADEMALHGWFSVVVTLRNRAAALTADDQPDGAR